MRLHASCAARTGPVPEAVLLLGMPGSGKSDLLLRLLHHGFALVADDQVIVDAGRAAAPPDLAGLLEVRGLGIQRLPFMASAPLALVVELGRGERLPMPARHATFAVPVVVVDPHAASAPQRVAMALDCAAGRVAQVAGAFAP